MSRDREYNLGKKTGLGSRSINSKCSFPPSYFSSIGTSAQSKSQDEQATNLNTSGFNINLSSKKKVKPRRSMLGRRSKNFSQNYDSSNFMKPLFSSSPKDNITTENFSTPKINKIKSSPPHPFSSDLNSSLFFESGQSNNFSTWSIFKKGNMHKPPRTPGKTKDLVKNHYAKVPGIETKKSFELDNTLEAIPLDSLSPKVTTKAKTAYKNKKLSMVKEETLENQPEKSMPEVIQEVPKDLSELFKQWSIAKQQWDKSKKQFNENTQKLNNLNEQINQILISQIDADKLSNTVIPDKTQISKKENLDTNSASKNDLIDNIYGELKASYSLLQTPVVS